MFAKIRTWGPALALISPTIILLGIFVYGLIAQNVQISMTNQHTSLPRADFVGLDNYFRLFGDADFQHSLRNLLLLTVVFLAGTLICLVGVLDDIFDLDALTKFGGQVLAVGVLVYSGIQFTYFYQSTGSVFSLDQARPLHVYDIARLEGAVRARR